MIASRATMDSVILVIIINIHTVNGYWQEVQIAMKIYSLSVISTLSLKELISRLLDLFKMKIWDHFSTLLYKLLRLTNGIKFMKKKLLTKCTFQPRA